MRYLWIVSAIMISVGVVLSGAGLLGVLEPIALVCGVLLLWSGIVKVIVLRIWRSSLSTARTAAPASKAPPVIPIGQRR